MESICKDSINIDRHCTPSGKLHQKAELFLKQIKRENNASYVDKDKMLYNLKLDLMKLEIQNKELRAIQEKLSDALDWYADLYNFSPVGYFNLDEKGRILELNLTGELMMNVPRNRLLGMSFADFITPDDRSIFKNFLNQLLSKEITQQCDVKLKKEISSENSLHIEGIFAPVIGKEGNQIRLVVSSNAKNKSVRGIQEKTFKMESLTSQNTGIVNNLSYLISVILGSAEMLKSNHENHARELTRINGIAEAATRASRLLELILTKSDIKETTSTSRLNLNEIVKYVISKQTQSVSPNIKVKLDTEPELWSINANPKMMATAVFNLYRNSTKSINKKGKIYVTTRNLEIMYDAVQIPEESKSEKYVYLEIEEEKISRPVKTKAETFVDLSDQALECDMELAASYGIVKNHGGYINMTSNDMYGSRIMVYLPAV